MDIKQIEKEETHWDDPVECVLYDDSGEPELDSKGEKVVFQVVGEFSTSVKRVAKRHDVKIRGLLRRYGAENIPQDEVDAMQDERVAASVVGWRGIESDGQPLPHSAETALLLVGALRKRRPKQYRQIEASIAAHASFFTKASGA